MAESGTDTGEPIHEVDSIYTQGKLSQPQRQPRTAGERWRPRRGPGNEAWNIGLSNQIRMGGQQNVENSGAEATAPTTAPTTASAEPPQRRNRHRKRRRTSPRPSLANPTPASPTEQPSPAPKRVRRPIPPDWTPPLAVGASLGENLSRLEQAERLVLQWEAILENARKTQPSSDLSSFERRVEKVRRERDAIEETEENLIPVEDLESTKRERIENRLNILKELLGRNLDSVGKVNINAAMDAYKDERIQCWGKWTLFYAGHIVDFCLSYESFTLDREQRLDRYFKQHGKGWLWFEPPLAPKGNVQPDHLFAATWAAPSSKVSNVWGGENSWGVTMGFRRVRAFHSRLSDEQRKPSVGNYPAELVQVGQQQKEVQDEPQKGFGDKRKRSVGKILKYEPWSADKLKKKTPDLNWTVHDDPDGPRCFFSMHLDSGATAPCLYDIDLDVLGIDELEYPPQTCVQMATATETVNTPLYEMRVDVCRYNGKSLVGDNPVWPRERHELGGIFPVAVIPGANVPIGGPPDGLSMEELKLRQQHGEDMSEEALAKRTNCNGNTRLSGLLPFQVCYSAGAPGLKFWFGEDRSDVLGADKMPGQRRWERHRVPRSQHAPLTFDLKDRPKTIAFEHEIGPGKRLIDTDVKGQPGASVVRVIDGSEVAEYRLEPRRLSAQRRRRTRAEAKAERDKKFLEEFQRHVARRNVLL
ncbi:Fc.00g003090.m01.CDS01 [Cosmosporella sp. VM-42]